MSKKKDEYGQNTKLTVMYDGTGYRGWQRLKDDKKENTSIQGLLEIALREILEEPIQVIGAGRTDAGVHALQQVCNFHTINHFDPQMVKNTLNRVLPQDIRILTAVVVRKDFHARYDAISKTYEYRIDLREREDVFTRLYTYPNYHDVDLDQMKQAAQYLAGTHDFKAFSTDRKDGKSTIRTIDEINIYRVSDKYRSELRIEYTGDGFLHHMIRILTGTLLEVGNGQRSVESVLEALNSQKRSMAGVRLYPQGLFLKQVSYSVE